jgi:hypothetical protein
VCFVIGGQFLGDNFTAKEAHQLEHDNLADVCFKDHKAP